jgi:phosphatidylglycerol lysyltransferase
MLRRMLRRTPVTIVIFLATVAFAIAGRGLRGPSLRLRLTLGTGYEQVIDLHRWWTPVTSVFLTDGGIELPVVLLAIVFILGPAERVLGSTRTAIAFLVSAIAGALAGIIVQEVGTALGELWSRRVTELVTLDPMTAIAGTIMAASAFATSLWRRRIRVLTFSVVLLFLLYSGQPSDLYRAIAALAGFALGVALNPGDGAIRWQRSSHHEARVLLSSVITITAVGPAITLFSKLRLGALAPLGLLLTDARPGGLPTVDECHAIRITRGCLHDMTLERISGVGPVLLTVLPLLTLLVAAIGLSRGRRFAAWLAIVVNVALAALGAYFYGFLPLVGHRFSFHFTTPHYWEVSLAIAVSVAVPLAIAALVAVNLRHVTVRASRRSVGGYLAGILVAFVGLSALYVGVGSLMPGSFHPRVSALDLLSDLPERFIPIGFVRAERLAFLPTHPIIIFLYYWIGPLFWLTVIGGALYVVLAPGTRLEAAGLARIRPLLRAGSGSLGFWSTWDGNSYWFSPDGRAAVAYRVVNGIALTTSEPIGPSDAAVAAVGQFARYCDDNGWVPVFYAIHDETLAVTTAMGWSSMSVGDETVVLPGEWKTEGKRWQDVRSSINRAERAEVRSLWTSYAALSPSHARQIGEISEQWVAEKDLPEMGFTLGGMDELRDHDVRLMLACDADDRVVGVTSWLPTWREGTIVGWTLDFMRRTPDGMNGIMEFLIARSAEHFREAGVEFMSLSAAPLAHQPAAGDESLEPSGAERVLAYVGSRLEPVYGFRSLFTFKRKFQPEFRQLWMAYPDPITLPAVGLALARAYVPSLSVRQSIRLIRGVS